MGILGLQERVRTRLFLRRDRYGRFFSVLVYHPARSLQHRGPRAHRSDADARAARASASTPTVQIGESPLAQLHLLIRPKSGESVDVDTGAAGSRTGCTSCATGRTNCATAWSHGTARSAGLKLANRYRHAPCRPVTSKSVTPELAASDVWQAGLADRRERPASVAVPHAPTAACASSCSAPAGKSRCRMRCRCWRTSACASISEHPYELNLDDGRVDHPGLRGRAARRQQSTSASSNARFEEAFARDLARRCRERWLQPSGPGRRPGLATGRDAARLLQVPAADRRTVLAEPTWKRRWRAIR